ncbi:hypothetical protein B0H11DRAFT_2343930 [Mycena galericulata]|nr:hypothetical protein B0H11DRAFT_2343930 [Mycena galericulata]
MDTFPLLSSSSFHGDDEYGSPATRILPPPPPYPRYFWPLFVCISPRHPVRSQWAPLETKTPNGALGSKNAFPGPFFRNCGDQPRGNFQLSASEAQRRISRGLLTVRPSVIPHPHNSPQVPPVHLYIEMAAKSSSNASSTRRYPTRSGSTPAPESNSTWPDPDPNNATTVTNADGAVPAVTDTDTAAPTNGTNSAAANDTNNASAPQNKLPAIPEGSTTEPAVPTATNDAPIVVATPVEQSTTSTQDQQTTKTAAPIDTPPVTVPTPPAVVETPSACHDDFPPLASPGPEVMESHADKRKKNKEKGKAKAKAAAPPAEPDLVMLDAPPAAAIARDYDEEADRNRGHACSLGHQTDVDAAGASSSHRAATTHATPDSPPKRQRADTAGRAIPTRGGGGGDVERPAARRRYYGTVDQLPPRGNFTPVPRGGFNRPEGITSRTLYRNLPPVQMGQWVKQDHPKLTAHISGGNGDRIQTARRIAQMIADRFNRDPAEILVGPPGLAAGPGPDPIAWLIGGLPLEQAHILADEGMIADRFNRDPAEILVGPPGLAAGPGPDPIAWLIGGLPLEQAHILADEGSSSPTSSPPISGFLGTFHGLTVAESNDQLARATLADAITDDIRKDLLY